ncbi:MAG: hypothetical protein AB7G93_03215 [Bdellovibrionales bacterium]
MKVFLLCCSLVTGLLFSAVFAAESGSADKTDKAPKSDKDKREKKADKANPADKEEDDDEKSEISQILDGLGYPELQVVPRASERLRMEARIEAGTWFVSHWPVEVSGLVTMYVGLSNKNSNKEDLSASEKDAASTINSVATAVGAGWLIGGLVLGLQRPYREGIRTIIRYKGEDERTVLTRERLAEEALEKPARTMRVLQTLSVITNLTVNVLSAVHADDKGKITAGVGALLAFLPVMFEDPTITVYDKHIEYKKKIYAPLKSASLHYDSETNSVTPMTYLVWQF